MPKADHGVYITFNDGTHNSLDLLILYHTEDQRKTITELSKLIDVAAKNIVIRVQHLEKLGAVQVERLGEGKPSYVTVKKDYPKIKDLLAIARMKVMFDEQAKKMTIEQQKELVKLIEDTSPGILGKQAVTHYPKGSPVADESSKSHASKGNEASTKL